MRNEIIQNLRSLEAKSLPMTEVARTKIETIIHRCNALYHDQGFYGHAALNRKILLDPVIADNLSSDVIQAIMCDKSDLTNVERIAVNKEVTLVPLKDILIHGFQEGLHAIELLPNNEKDYNLAIHLEQRNNFEKNTKRILAAIQLASGRTESCALPTLLVASQARFKQLLDTLDLFKTDEHESDQLLQITGYTAQEISNQMESGFAKLCKKLQYQPSSISIDTFCEKWLTNNNGAVLLDGDISHLFYDRLHLTAALISEEKIIFSDGEYRYRDLFEKMVKKINDHPGAYQIAEEQISLRVELIENNLVKNFSRKIEAYKKGQKFLRQGPVKEKNKAHQDVLYVLYSLVGIEFPVQRNEDGVVWAEHNEYLPSLPHTLTTQLSTNSLGQIEVTCPNGKTYNLSCALRNANLDYFRLLQESHGALLTALEAQPGISTGTPHTIFQIEEAAIGRYTGQSGYQNINALLRGQPITLTEPEEIKKLILDALLAISGVNKNVSAVQSTQSKPIVRLTQDLPIDITSQMTIPYGFSYLSGLTSFSALKGGAKYFQDSAIAIYINDTSGRLSIRQFSKNPEEAEILHPPLHLIFPPQALQTDESGKLTISAHIAHGLVTAKDHYSSELALIQAYDKHLRHRSNPALAHHVRITSYAKPVIDYFKDYAAGELKYFCAQLSHHDIELIKVVLAFLKTGWKSDCDFNDPKYIEYANASCAHLKSFMRDRLIMTDNDIEPYLQMIRNFATPGFSDISPDDNNETKKIKHTCHIIRFTHELDNPSYVRNEKSPLITSSELQKAAFEQLEKLALYSIIETGDKLPPGYSCDRPENPAQFKQSNTDVFYCLARCKYANVLSKAGDDKKSYIGNVDNMSRLNQIIKKNASLIKSSATANGLFSTTVLTSHEKKTLLDIVVPNLSGLELNTGELKALFETAEITSAQKEEIVEFILKKHLQRITKFSDVMTLLQMSGISAEQKEKLLTFILENRIFFSEDDIKTLFEFKVVTPEQKEKIIDFLILIVDEAPHFEQIKLFLSFRGITTEQQKKLLNLFVDATKKRCAMSSAGEVRLFLNLLNFNQKEIFFKNLIESSADVFFKLSLVVTPEEMNIYFSIWMERLIKALQKELDEYPQTTILENNEFRMEIIRKLDLDVAITCIREATQLAMLLNCNRIQSEYRLLMLLKFNNRQIKDDFFKKNSPDLLLEGMQLNLGELKEINDKFEKLKEHIDQQSYEASMLKAVIQDPLNLEKLSCATKQIDDILSDYNKLSPTPGFFQRIQADIAEFQNKKTLLEAFANALLKQSESSEVPTPQ